MVSENTQKKYNYMVNKLNLSKSDFKSSILKKKVISISQNIGTQKNYWQAILNVYGNELNEDVYQYVKCMISTLRSEQRDDEEQNLMNERQKRKSVEWDDVVALSDKLSGKEQLLLSLYVDIPPRRVQDYTNMHIVKQLKRKHDIDKNYYVMSKQPYFLFYDFKTKDRYDRQKIVLPAKLKKKVNNYILDHKVDNNTKLLKIGNVQLLNRMKKIFMNHMNQDIDINSLRHSYVTKISKDPTLTVARRRKIADSMAHTINTQLLYNKIG